MKTLIIDDHAAIRRGLKAILQEEYPEIQITGAGDAQAAVSLVQEQPWDVVLCDINLPGRNGLELLKEIKSAQPATPVLMLSMHPEELFAMRALKAGASGYMTKDCDPDELISAVRTLLTGRKYISSRMAEQLASNVSNPSDKQPHERLSDRELEVFLLLASGKEVKEVAGELGISVKTVSTHREHILQKMQLRNNAALTVYAVRNNLIE